MNGCTRAGATDMTGMAAVDADAWALNHAMCIVVDVGTIVTWTGDFQTHPLVGGVTPTTDDASPITKASESNGATAVTFDTMGAYPYFCTVHKAGMQGVVYVAE